MTELGRPDDRSSPTAAPRSEPPRSALSVRALVLDVLHQHNSQPRSAGRFIEDQLDERLTTTAYDGRDRGLIRELTLGVVRHRRTLDAVRAAYSHRPPEQIQPLVLEGLRLGLYQIVFLDRVPAFAAVDQTVEALRELGHGSATGFANGILRSVLRDVVGRFGPELAPLAERGPRRNEIPIDAGRVVRFGRAILPVVPRGEPPSELLAAAYSYPTPLVERWLRTFGSAATEQLLAVGNLAPPITLRVNRLRTNREELLTRLIADGVAAQPTAGAGAEAVVLDRPGRPIGDVAAFREGLASVQDLTAMEVGLAVAPEPGQTVLDLCASPGGKATHLAELMGDRGRVIASDLSEEKLLPIRQNAARLGITILHTVVGEQLSSAASPSSCDRVLVDVPCSNTGVLARRAEARWRMRSPDLSGLAAQQLTLLRRAAEFVRVGGRLIYSTCSIEPTENQQLVESFVSAAGSFALREQHTQLPAVGLSSAEWRDGGFRAVLERTR